MANKLKPEDIETDPGAEERFERTVRNMLNTPPRQHQEDVGKVKTVKQPKHIRKADDDGSNSD